MEEGNDLRPLEKLANEIARRQKRRGSAEGRIAILKQKPGRRLRGFLKK